MPLWYKAGFPRLTTRYSWLFPFLVLHPPSRYEESHPRRFDCPGSFRSRQSSGTAFKLLYSIFLCLSRHRYIFEGDIFLDEQIDRVRLSLDHLLRANPYGTIIQRLKQSVYKDYMNIKLTILLESASPQFIRTPNQRLWYRASCGGC